MRVRSGISVRGDDFRPRTAVTEELQQLGRNAVCVDLLGAGSIEAFLESVINALASAEQGRRSVTALAQARAILPSLAAAVAFHRLRVHQVCEVVQEGGITSRPMIRSVTEDDHDHEGLANLAPVAPLEPIKPGFQRLADDLVRLLLGASAARPDVRR